MNMIIVPFIIFIGLGSAVFLAAREVRLRGLAGLRSREFLAPALALAALAPIGALLGMPGVAAWALASSVLAGRRWSGA